MADLLIEPSELSTIVEAIRQGKFSEADASRLYHEGEEAVKFVLLALAARPPCRSSLSRSLPTRW